MNSPLCYIGGKSKLSKIIVPRIPAHESYCEVFAGAAWVFFRKEPSHYEFINDIDGSLVAFYRVLQYHLEEFLRQFKWLLSSREWWEDWKKQLAAGGLTDIQRAAHYYYLQRQCFCGRVHGRTWGSPVESTPKINLVRMEEELSAVHLRLTRVVVENLDWSVFVKKYDKSKTFFYIDPPYYKIIAYTENFMKISDFESMANVLAGIKGKFILSINDVPEIRKVFRAFVIKPVRVGYSAGLTPSIGKELLIANFK